MSQVLDYSAGFPGAEQIRNRGFAGAVRYIGSPGNPKCTTAAELEDFRVHGLGMALVFEAAARDWWGGFGSGFSSAVRARAHALDIGFSPSRPIYMAVDSDVVSEDDYRRVVDYLRGASSVLDGPAGTGVYGEHEVCVRAAQSGYVGWFWQCRAWSGSRVFEGRHLYQRAEDVVVAGVVCDVNDTFKPDWGQDPAPDKRGVDPMSLLPVSLPAAPDGDTLALPFEVDDGKGFSAVVRYGWLRLLATYGPVDYEVIMVGSAGAIVGEKSSPTRSPTRGTLAENHAAVWELPQGCAGVAVHYTTHGGSRLGYAFPQVTK